MNKKNISIISFYDYNFYIKFFLEKILNCNINYSNIISDENLELGIKYSPSNTCLIFKYILGSYIDCLNNGTNILIQVFGRCKYGYFDDLHIKILQDLGYEFEFYSLFDYGSNHIISLYKKLKKLNCKINFFKYLYYLLLLLLMNRCNNRIENYISKNIGFEINKGSFERVKKSMINSFSNSKGYIDFIKKYFYYKKKYKSISIDKPKKIIKVGVVGKLNILDNNYFIEKNLASMNIEVIKKNNISLFNRNLIEKYYLRRVKKYCKYNIGFNLIKNIYNTSKLICKGYNGIIHVKPHGCICEISEMKIIEKICNVKDVPIVFLTINEKFNENDVKLNLKAFYDILIIKKL